MASWPRGQREEARRTHSEKSVTFASIIVERHPGSRIEARFAIATEHPDHDAYECRHKDQKVDCPSHGYSPPRAALIRGTLVGPILTFASLLGRHFCECLKTPTFHYGSRADPGARNLLSRADPRQLSNRPGGPR